MTEVSKLVFYSSTQQMVLNCWEISFKCAGGIDRNVGLF